MVGREDPTVGRSKFELVPGSDYSGITLADRYLVAESLAKSFFNGSDLRNCVFRDVPLNNTEFAEAAAHDCRFERCNLSGSDFIHSTFEHVIFLGCDFSMGEWREASFLACQFIGCVFDHTTVTLCEFQACRFDAETLASADHRSVYFNVFSRCELPTRPVGLAFASRNFGVPITGEPTELVSLGSKVSLEQVCLINNAGHLKSVTIADAADSLRDDLQANGRRRNSALAFFAKIVRVLTAERRISATTLIYLEDSISRLAAAVDDQDVFIAAMSAVIEIRSALFAISEEAADFEDPDTGRQTVTIYFSETYSRRQAEVLRETLALSAGLAADDLEITAFRNGSTLIEIVSVSAMSISAILTSLNFVLRQAVVTVERVAELKRAWRKLTPPPRRQSNQRALSQRAPKVQSVLGAGAVSPSLAPVRNAVRQHGRIIVEMDDRATVTILTQDADLG